LNMIRMFHRLSSLWADANLTIDLMAVKRPVEQRSKIKRQQPQLSAARSTWYCTNMTI
jgi:hypothetical protein